MVCKYCGRENPEGSRFCNYCGEKIEDAAVLNEISSEGEDSKDDFADDDLKEEYSFSDYLKENKKMPAVILAAVFLLFGIVVIATGVFSGRYGHNEVQTASVTHSSTQEISADIAPEAIDPIDEKSLDFSKVMNISGFEKIDLNLVTHTPGEKQKGMDWDESLLDGSGEKTVYTFTDKSDGKEISFEVYTDPDTKKINKITTLKEYSEGLLDIVDYCYHDEKPCYIYQRYETVYTPTYDSTAKTGVRFYFSDDVLVRSRTVVPGSLLVSQTGLSLQGNPDYEEFDYFTAPDAIRAQYEQFEKEWLSRGYNVLGAVKNKAPTGKVTGRVVNSQQNALGGVSVLIQNSSTGDIVYAANTDIRGGFDIYTREDDENYRICVLAGDDLKDVYINDVTFDRHRAVYDYGDIVMYPGAAEACNVSFGVFDGETYKSASRGEGGIPARICLREGYNNKYGPEVLHLDTDEKGSVEGALEPGFYTAEVFADGYATSFINIEVTSYGCKKQLFLVKEPKAGTATVLLTWDADTDADLIVFTPVEGDMGDMVHIGGVSLKDERGNAIASDNINGCESAQIKLSKDKSYKVYVSDYSNLDSGCYGSDVLSKGATRLYVFYPDGDCRQLDLGGGYGVVWEALEISQGTFNVYDRLYNKLGGNLSWLMKKDIVRSQENVLFRSGMQISGRLESDFTYAYMDPDWIHSRQFFLNFDVPVSIGIEENGAEHTLKYSSIDVKFEFDRDYDIIHHLGLHLGQYVTGVIKQTGTTEEGKPYIVLQSLTLLNEKNDDVTVPKEYLAMLADKVKEGSISYNIIYVNDNPTPELVIIYPVDASGDNKAEIYTYDNGEVELMGTFGLGEGRFTYYPMKNLIFSEVTGTGSHQESYSYFDGHKVYTVRYESSFSFPEYGITRVLGQYTTNGTEYVNPLSGRESGAVTTPDDYEKQIESMFKDIDRSTGRYINADACLKASKIEDIRFR